MGLTHESHQYSALTSSPMAEHDLILCPEPPASMTLISVIKLGCLSTLAEVR